MIAPVLLYIGIGTLVAVVAVVLGARLGKFLSQEGPEAPEKSAADLVAELANQERPDRVKSLFFEELPRAAPEPTVAVRSGDACRMVIFDEQGRELASFDLRKS